MKKFLSLFLVLITIFSMFSISASAEGFTYNFSQENKYVGPHCKSLFMVNADTGTVVYSMNPDEVRSMASLTKIMTYIVVVENIPDVYNTKVTVTQSVIDELAGTGSSVADIYVGEEFTVYDLLHLMMIPSGNDAALTLSKYIDSLGITKRSLMNNTSPDSPQEDAESGSTVSQAENNSQSEASGDEDPVSAEEDLDKPLTCVDLMNMKAAELGCDNTHFMNAHGLYDEDHYTTARDFMTITLYARNLPDFTDITSSSIYYYPKTNMREENSDYRLTTNKMLRQSEQDYFYTYATGIKTGSLNESGYCIAASAVFSGYTYVVIALGSPYIDEYGNDIDLHGEMLDAAELFRWAFTSLEIKTISTAGEVIADIDLNYAWKKDRLQLACAETISTILPKNVEQSSIMAKLDLPESVDAPVKKGDVIGKATLTYADEEIATVDLIAAESVEHSEILVTLDQGKSVLTSKWFLGIMAAIILLIVVYLILIIVYRKRRKNLKKVKKYRDM